MILSLISEVSVHKVLLRSSFEWPISLDGDVTRHSLIKGTLLLTMVPRAHWITMAEIGPTATKD
jgi:hypothetical protein